MSQSPIEMTEQDHEFYESELASFVPDRVFDAHTHIWHAEHKPPSLPQLPETVNTRIYRELMDVLHPGREMGALFIPWAKKELLHQGNEWVGENTAAGASFRGLFWMSPADDPEWVRQEVKRLRLHGLKVYHNLAPVERTWDADIPDFLPEAHVKVAHEEGWAITLHMVKARAAADPGNIRWIRHYCESYPNMKLILAHSARGFQPAHNLEGLPHLTGLDNLYFDTSANCEPIAHQAIMRIIGHDKLLYGSDLPVSHLRGRQMAAADSFVWVYDDVPVWGEKHLQVQPALIGHEHLRSIKWACWSERLSDNQVEDIFWNNAAKLFGLS